MIAKYVAGFLFSSNKKRVLLVTKTHPEWQKGLVNGIGGTIEPDETPFEAMKREFKEETGYYTPLWDHFATEEGPGYEVSFYRYTVPDGSKYDPPAANDKGEEIKWFDPLLVSRAPIGNLNWLLPMALDPRPIQCRVVTTGDIRKLKTW